MAETPCIYKGLADILIMFVRQDQEPEFIEKVINSFPICKEGDGPAKATTRAPAEMWPDAVYYDKDGSTKEGSFSGLFKEIYGAAVTEDMICRYWGDKQECRSPSTVENFRNRGDIVKGNGEPAPAATEGMSAGQVERLFKTWKNHLIADNMKIHIYHPDNPDIKKATETVKKKSEK